MEAKEDPRVTDYRRWLKSAVSDLLPVDDNPDSPISQKALRAVRTANGGHVKFAESGAVIVDSEVGDLVRILVIEKGRQNNSGNN